MKVILIKIKSRLLFDLLAAKSIESPLNKVLSTSNTAILMWNIFYVTIPINIVVNNQLITVTLIPLSFNSISSGFSAV